MKIKKHLIIIFVAIMGLAIIINAYAAPTSGTKTSTAKLKNPLGEIDTVGELAGQIVKTLMGVVGVIAVLMLIWGGIMYMTSAGNDEKIGTAKKIITGAIIGLVVSILAYVIVDFVIKAIGGST